jgi:magnesium-transporting ATPase (P-type)
VSSFAGSTLFNSLCVTSYNALLFVPIVSFILNRDVTFQTALMNPPLYAECARDKQFNARTFFLWVLRAMLQAMCAFLITIFSWGPDFVNGKGHPADWETLGILAFCGFLWIQSITMTIELQSIAWWNVILIWGFHVLTFIVLFATNTIQAFDSLNGYGIVNMALFTPTLWITNLLMVIATVMPVVAIKYYNFNYNPEPIDHLRYMQKMQDGLAIMSKSAQTRDRKSTSTAGGVEMVAIQQPDSPLSPNADKRPFASDDRITALANTPPSTNGGFLPSDSDDLKRA